MAEDNRGEWSTEEGPVIIALEGDIVVLGESFEPAIFNKLMNAALAEIK
jgi:hypothetical protein